MYARKMFDEMPPEHFHQFIASSTTQLPPNFPPNFDHHHPSSNYYNNNHLHSQFLLHHNNKLNINQTHLLSSANNDDQRSIPVEISDLWSNEEVLELLRIRSNMDQINWFPHHFTWNHVSRKLGELGFKRSPENCKEKFEEESQHFSNNIANTKNYTFFGELEEICHGDQNPPMEEEDDDIDNEENTRGEKEEEDRNIQLKLEKRKKRFGKLKEFFEEIVNKMISQQEHLNNKLIRDMLKRDEENVAKEEAWKKLEMERINKEMESRAQEHAVAKERHDKIIEFINKFTSNSRNPNHRHNKLESAASSSSNYTGTTLSEKDDTGKRWPRDEVLALINLRSNHYRDEKAGLLARGPLWERISKGMMELGYNRSAKRCKEKWENINKYYRKTKDANKKRSVDSRTCPYFHQLSTLYRQTAFDHPENRSLTDNYHHVDNVLHGDDDDFQDEEGKGETNLV